MQITEKIETLFKKCKCSVTTTNNNHKNGYKTVDTNITNLKQNSIIDNDDISLDILEKMKELDTIIEIQFYPDTPIGSYSVYSYDINDAIDKALLILNENTLNRNITIRETLL